MSENSTLTHVGLDQLPSMDDEIECKATLYVVACGNAADWLLIMGCGHSGPLCSSCRARFITMLTHSARFGCAICDHEVDSPDDVEWRRL